jgi:hypothetical protein
VSIGRVTASHSATTSPDSSTAQLRTRPSSPVSMSHDSLLLLSPPTTTSFRPYVTATLRAVTASYVCTTGKQVRGTAQYSVTPAQPPCQSRKKKHQMNPCHMICPFSVPAMIDHTQSSRFKGVKGIIVSRPPLPAHETHSPPIHPSQTRQSQASKQQTCKEPP